MSYKIPLFKLNFNHLEKEALIKTLDSKWISTGPQCALLEENFSDKINSKHAISMSSCTSALHLAFKALNIGEDDEVICPSLTFVASTNAILYVGAKPIFCDVIGNEDLNIDPLEIEKLITPKTKAIIVVHFAGFPCKMAEIMELASKHNLKVIEDACHGPFSEYNKKKLGTIGDIGCFSFFSNKNISSGEGGMLITNNSEIDKRIRLLRSHGMTTMSYQRSKGHSTEYDVVELGYNYRMDDLRASIANVQLNKLQSDLENRITVRKVYIERLETLKDIFIPFKSNTRFVSNYIMPIVLKNSNKQKRDEVRSKLADNGIQTSIHYPAIHKFSIYKNYTKSLPKTEYITDNEITLPMYGTLSKGEIFFICDTLKDILND